MIFCPACGRSDCASALRRMELSRERKGRWKEESKTAPIARITRFPNTIYTKQLERENAELRRANEILRKAAAFFAQAELDRRGK